MTALGYIFSFLLIVFLGAVWSAFVLISLWEWFIVPTFGLPPLGCAEALGVILVVGYLTSSTPKSDNSNAADTITKVAIHTTLKPLIFLVFGYVYSLFL